MKQEQQNVKDAVQVHGKRLFSFIRSRTKNQEDAEDILQDVWYALSSIADTEPIEQLSAWLYRVSKNRIVDKMRKQAPLSLENFVYENDDGELIFPEDLLVDEIKIETEIENEYFMESLLKALGELPEKQRQVFVWNELENLTLQQIADKTGENIKTIISRKRYAVEQLRKLLQHLYYE
jgi:RNA polymerase sigma factor (sigma-70 family)